MMYAKDLRLSHPVPQLTELPPRGLAADSLAEDFRRYYTLTLGRDKHCRSVDRKSVV